MRTVLVSGASGFVASHTIQELLSRNFKVVGTVRSPAEGEKLLNHFKAKFPRSAISWEVVEDIGEKGAFDEALKKTKDLNCAIHIASPILFGLGNDVKDTFITPAIQGTINMLKGVKTYAPQVTNIVTISSFAAAINHGTDPKTFVHTEETWNPITLEQSVISDLHGYIGSKKLAELAAWDFVKKESPNYKLTTLIPPFCFGPQVFESNLANEKLNGSAEVINKLLKTKPGDELVGHHTNLSVDVRDVAQLLVQPLNNPELENRRLLPVSGDFSPDKLLLLITKLFPELKGQIAEGDPAKAAEAEANMFRYDNTVTKQLTGIEFTPFEKSVYDAVKQILDYKAKNQ